jgi:GNAT superfamily N-acetyltransferase
LAKTGLSLRGLKMKLAEPVPLSAEHDLTIFDCGESALNDWLKHRALKNESRFSRTYVVCEDKRVVGYFCISAGAVERAAVPNKLKRNAPDIIPVSVIGRLAVSASHAGKGLGADLLADALRRAVDLAPRRVGGGRRRGRRALERVDGGALGGEHRGGDSATRAEDSYEGEL